MHITELIKQGKFVITCEIDSPKGVNQEDFLDKVDVVRRDGPMGRTVRWLGSVW